MTLMDDILDITPGDGSPVNEWFLKKLESHVKSGLYPTKKKLESTATKLVKQLKDYRDVHRIDDVVIGMSGGVDSATTAALFKEAGWHVHGATLPIHQKPEETVRGIEAIDILRLERYEFDLSSQYDSMKDFLAETESTYRGLQRQGNIRARLRMMTLYNLAHKLGGCVGSTDNFSELAAGFWTLHGDVGDIAPIQSLSKSWEVPMIARLLGVPEPTIAALPTDGLGISNSDADQLGMQYIEFDILLFEFMSLPRLTPKSVESYINKIKDVDVKNKAQLAYDRIRNTAYKRNNPLNLSHPVFKDRFEKLEKLDRS